MRGYGLLCVDIDKRGRLWYNKSAFEEENVLERTKMPFLYQKRKNFTYISRCFALKLTKCGYYIICKTSKLC